MFALFVCARMYRKKTTQAVERNQTQIMIKAEKFLERNCWRYAHVIYFELVMVARAKLHMGPIPILLCTRKCVTQIR